MDAGGWGIKIQIFMKKGQLIKILVNNKAKNIRKDGIFSQIIGLM